MNRKRYVAAAVILVVTAFALSVCIASHAGWLILSMVTLVGGMLTYFILPLPKWARDRVLILAVGSYFVFEVWSLIKEFRDDPPDWHAIFIDDWYVTLTVCLLPLVFISWLVHRQLAKPK